MAKVKTAVAIDADVFKAIEEKAEAMRMSKSAVVNRILLKELVFDRKPVHGVQKQD